MLICFYTNNFVHVSWCGLFSEYFLAMNGVKQGGVLSLVLFCVYIDDLLVLLSNANIGCFIGNNFVGAVAYADDLVLLAPSASALRKMLAICDAYAAEYCMSFNAQKAKCLVILSNACRYLRPLLLDNVFYIGGKPIDFVSSFPHLGNIITDTLDDGPDITKKLGNFIGCVMFLVRCSLMLRHVCLKHTVLASTDVNCGICWPAACLLSVRRGAKVSDVFGYTMHCHLLPLLCNCTPIFDEICRSFKFIQTCLSHNATVVRSVARFSLTEGRNSSPCGRNVLFCLQRFQCAYSNVVSSISSITVDALVSRYVLSSISDTQWHESELLRELISIRDRALYLPSVFIQSEVATLIEYVCTS